MTNFNEAIEKLVRGDEDGNDVGPVTVKGEAMMPAADLMVDQFTKLRDAMKTSEAPDDMVFDAQDEWDRITDDLTRLRRRLIRLISSEDSWLL